MPVRFQRRIRISPGISLNLNKRSVSASFGRRGAHITVGPKGGRTTIGLPGTGLSYTKFPTIPTGYRSGHYDRGHCAAVHFLTMTNAPIAPTSPSCRFEPPYARFE